MGRFDDIKQALNGNTVVLTEKEQPSPTNFVQKLQNARADVTQKKVGVAQEAFQKKLTQLRTIVDVLMSSGNGKTKEDAFYVIDISHEYNLLSILGFQFGGSQHLIEHYDYLSVAENNQNIEGFYFDVSPCLNSILK